MLTKLCKYLETPPPYAPSDAGIWTDDHISKQMLFAHLDPDFEGASRTHDFIDRSVSWIKERIPPSQGSNLIDIGCGPGIYTERFCQSGYQVTGIDFSKRSIQYARDSAGTKKLEICYLHQNYLEMNLHNCFDSATFIYCDYGALSTTDRAVILKNIYRCLKPGGKLLLDVFSMSQYDQFEESRTWEHCPYGGFWNAGRYLAIHEAKRYAANLTLRQTTILTEDTTRCFYLWDTYFSKETLRAEAQAAGFKTCEFFSDIAGSAYKKESPTLCVLLQK